MNTVLADDDNHVKLNLLVAYPYITKALQDHVYNNREHVRFLLDSGAFTAWRAGKTIKLDDYYQCLESLRIRPWRYFTLDVVGDPHGSMRNYQSMLSKGYNPLPIFTRGEKLPVLDQYYETSDVVGIGGLVQTTGNKGFINGIMKQVGTRRVHWLGFTNFDYIKHYKPYMCDSSSWESGPRYGRVKLYMGRGQFIAFGRSLFATKPSGAVLDRLHQLGFDPYVFRKASSWHGGDSPIRNLCAASAVALSIDIQQNIGTKMFIAAATDYAVKMLTDQFKHQRKNRL